MSQGSQPLDSRKFRQALREAMRQRSPLPLMKVLYKESKRFFRIPLPGFRAFVVGGPAANRQILVSDRTRLLWRAPDDPVTKLLRKGVLVVDGEEHDQIRQVMEPPLSPGYLANYVPSILRQVDRVTASWQSGMEVDMLVESRKIALLIIMETLFSIDFWDDLPQLWKPILKTIEYISPGAWIIIPKIPRPGYQKQIKIVDQYLNNLIANRRRSDPVKDLLGHLITAGLDDQCIRDQMLTMLIAGHDTSTALLAWTFYLLGTNPEIYQELQGELDRSLQGSPPSAPSGWQPQLLDDVIKETLRLYPPIHLGNRRVEEALSIDGNSIPQGQRLIYSIYLTHRDPEFWEESDEFRPQRFSSKGQKPPPFSYVPFGGGPRACIGAAFGQMEARIVLARLIQEWQFELKPVQVHAHMGATLEPHPGVKMKITRRS